MTNRAPRAHDYGQRDVEAARRVLVDLGQVLGSMFADSIVSRSEILIERQPIRISHPVRCRRA